MHEDENKDIEGALPFEEKARQLLDESLSSIDGATLSRLHQSRNRALERKKILKPWIQWSGGGAIAASILFTASLYYQPAPTLPSIYEDPAQQAAAEDIELLNDLEFVAWLLLEESEDGESINEVSSS